MHRFSFILAVLRLAVAADAFAWSQPETDALGNAHADLRATNGAEIHITYRIADQPLIIDSRRYAGVHLATHVAFRVTGIVAQKVDIQIEFYEQRYAHVGPDAPLVRSYAHFDRRLPLAPSDLGFQGDTESLAVERFDSSAGDGYLIYQKLRVLVDGQALIDPISGTDQFQILLIRR
jgi:hypothetical protein